MWGGWGAAVAQATNVGILRRAFITFGAEDQYSTWGLTLALHVLEAMEAFQKSSDEGCRIHLETTVERPAMIPAGLATAQLD